MNMKSEDGSAAKTLEVMNGVMEDIANEIGFTAANSLIDWFGGGNLHIPTTAHVNHPIAKVCGLSAMRRLVAMYEGRIGNQRLLWVPMAYEREIARRDRMIAAMFAHGWGTKAIMNITGMSERHVQQVRLKVEQMGLLPLIVRQAGLREQVVSDE